MHSSHVKTSANFQTFDCGASPPQTDPEGYLNWSAPALISCMQLVIKLVPSCRRYTNNKPQVSSTRCLQNNLEWLSAFLCYTGAIPGSQVLMMGRVVCKNGVWGKKSREKPTTPQTTNACCWGAEQHLTQQTSITGSWLLQTEEAGCGSALSSRSSSTEPCRLWKKARGQKLCLNVGCSFL